MKRSTRRTFEQAIAFFALGLAAGVAVHLAREDPASVDFRERALLGGCGLVALAALFWDVRQADEFERHIHSVAISTAFLGTALTTLAYGVVQPAGSPPPSWIWIFLLITTLAVLGGTAANYWYRR